MVELEKSFTEVPGAMAERAVTVYALSTCGFCRRALEYLSSRGIAYRYVYMDTLEDDVRKTVKKRLQAEYGRRILYPFTVADRGATVLTGFIEPDWDLTFSGNR